MAATHRREQRSRGPAVLAAVAILASLLTTWVLSGPASEIDQARRRFAGLQRQVAAAREARTARQGDRGRVMRLRAQARAASGAQRDAFDAEASALEARLAWGDPVTVRAAVLSEPLIAGVTRLSELVGRSGDRTAALMALPRERGQRCLACHLTIDVPGYESYPQPFRTHSKPSNYVGASSPHPPSRVRCESCHQGDGHASTFADAGHATLQPGAIAASSTRRVWRDPTADGAMLPVGRVEASCVTCHATERYQPGAPALNEALVTLERGGCYACHDVPGMGQAPRRGPDLRHLAVKSSRAWVKRWLANPRAMKPSTWMPRFWSGGTPEEDAAAIDAVTTYLFENSQPFAPTVSNPPRGDAPRGQAIVESVGCMGCHIVGSAPRDESSLRRTFGQPLEGLAGKTTYVWLFDWVRDPSHYSPGTRMPNLRLSTQDAADVATYLSTLDANASPAPTGDDDNADDRYRRVIARYAAPAGRGQPDTAALSGVALRVAAGRTVVERLGCFNCHETPGFEDRRTTVPMTARPVWADADMRTVHAGRSTARPGDAPVAEPDFGFGANEVARLALALTTVAGRTRDTHALSTPWHLAKVAGRTLVQERNCVGCHEVEATGGDVVELVAEPSLGPPLLTPEGARVKPDWMRRFLRQPSTIRPWLSVRMPTFGLSDDEVEIVRGYFTEIAQPNAAPGEPRAGVTASRGRELFDLLKCQQCHVLGDIPEDQPTANLAPDLRLARDRLQPDWILAWLRNPSAILPGTRMPTFWPDYPKSFYPQFDGDAAAQVRAIREHLLTLR